MTNVETTTKNPFLSAVWYDRLKFIGQILLPALGALYFGLSAIWGFPAGEAVVGTITLVDIFLGALLLADSKRYAKTDAKFDGALVLATDEEGTEIRRFELDAPLNDVIERGEVVLKLTNPSA